MPPSPTFSIRRATREDVPAIVNLVAALAEFERLRHEMRATAAQFEQYGFGETAYYQALIAETGEGKAVGFALYFFTFSTFVGKPTLKLEDLFVLPPYRGQGLGRRLLAELAVIARERDCGRMEWDVLDWNEPAIRFYQSLNAAPLSEWITYRLLPPDIEELSKMAERNG